MKWLLDIGQVQFDKFVFFFIFQKILRFQAGYSTNSFDWTKILILIYQSSASTIFEWRIILMHNTQLIELLILNLCHFLRNLVYRFVVTYTYSVVYRINEYSDVYGIRYGYSFGFHAIVQSFVSMMFMYPFHKFKYICFCLTDDVEYRVRGTGYGVWRTVFCL